MLWSEYINWRVPTGATGFKLGLCGRLLCLSIICLFFLIHQCGASQRRPVSYQKEYRNSFEIKRKDTLDKTTWRHLGLNPRRVCCCSLWHCAKGGVWSKWSGRTAEQAIYLHQTLSPNDQHPAANVTDSGFSADCVVTRSLVEQPLVFAVVAVCCVVALRPGFGATLMHMWGGFWCLQMKCIRWGGEEK